MRLPVRLQLRGEAAAVQREVGQQDTDRTARDTDDGAGRGGTGRWVRTVPPAANGGDQSSDLVAWGISGVLIASASASRAPSGLSRGPVQGHVRGVDALEVNRARAELALFVADVFASLTRKDQRAKGDCYLRRLMLDGRRKSIQPTAERLPDGNEQKLRQFVNQSTPRMRCHRRARSPARHTRRPPTTDEHH